MTAAREFFDNQDFNGLAILADAGQHEASLFCALMSYSGKWQVDDGKFPTKKAAKDYVLKKAMALLKSAADDNYLPALIEMTDVCMFGRKEKGSFGSTIVLASARKGIDYSLATISHADVTPEQKSMAHYKLGAMIELVSRPHQEDPDRHYAHIILQWEAAIELAPKSESAYFAAMRLAEVYFLETNQPELAIPIFESITDKMPYAYAHLSIAYRQGKGVKEDKAKSAELFELWNDNVENYKMKCGSAQHTTINII